MTSGVDSVMVPTEIGRASRLYSIICGLEQHQPDYFKSMDFGSAIAECHDSSIALVTPSLPFYYVYAVGPIMS